MTNTPTQSQPDIEELIERLESHMGKADMGDVLRDCRLAAKALRTSDEARVRAEGEAERLKKPPVIADYIECRGRTEAAEARIKALEATLQRVERWHGEFPATGQFWDEDKNRPMSYGACFGSNGERDFMRSLARDALSSSPPPEDALAKAVGERD